MKEIEVKQAILQFQVSDLIIVVTIDVILLSQSTFPDPIRSGLVALRNLWIT